jgi:hypothetical protein
MKKISLYLLLAALFVGLAACGSGGGGGGGGAGLNGATSMTGTMYSQNGDPMPGVTVSIPTASAAMVLGKATRTKVLAITGADGTPCNDPSQTACASTCSGANGSFTLDTTTCTGTETQALMELGNLRKTLNLDCPSGGGVCTLSTPETTFGSGGGTTWPKVAVVTGSYDRIQDVLAKIAPAGYGTVDDYGELQPGTENTTNLTFIDGNSSLSDTYKEWDTYLNGTNSLSGFDIVFINCGNSFDYLLADAAVRSVLQNYVTGGGILYVTDLSYDFINQPFPQVMDFEGDVNATTPGAIDAAQNGTDGVTVNAAINDSGMAGWLANVKVIQHDASTPGNPNFDCSGTYTTRTGALMPDGKIPLGDFLSFWARMQAAWDANTTIWISSGAGVDFDGVINRPLTVSRYGTADASLGTGRVFYSSYHTADSCPTTHFWPQERVLEYLIFQAF